MAKSGETAIRIVCRSDGLPTRVDGEFVVEYDPALKWVGGDRSYKLVTSSDVREALGFAGVAAATACWARVCPNLPKRADGEPNRPLTAYTIELYRVP